MNTNQHEQTTAMKGDDLSKTPEAVVGLQDVPIGTEVVDQDIDHEYLASSKWPKFYRGVLFQMLLFGA